MRAARTADDLLLESINSLLTHRSHAVRSRRRLQGWLASSRLRCRDR